jgi:hypothetical protein
MKCTQSFCGETSWETSTEHNIKMDLRETGCEDGRWMEIAHDCVQWRSLVLAVLSIRVLQPEHLVIYNENTHQRSIKTISQNISTC